MNGITWESIQTHSNPISDYYLDKKKNLKISERVETSPKLLIIINQLSIIINGSI
jgi:hypothetical protein